MICASSSLFLNILTWSSELLLALLVLFRIGSRKTSDDSIVLVFLLLAAALFDWPWKSASPHYLHSLSSSAPFRSYSFSSSFFPSLSLDVSQCTRPTRSKNVHTGRAEASVREGSKTERYSQEGQRAKGKVVEGGKKIWWRRSGSKKEGKSLWSVAWQHSIAQWDGAGGLNRKQGREEA